MVAGIRQNFTKSFFKPSIVQRKKDRATKRVMTRFGAFVRVSARSSIRKRKKSAAPGKPPSSHVGSLRRLILFGYDASRRSVVVGPLPFTALTKDQPRTLEQGGGSQVVTFRNRKKERKRVFVKARPFMGPALQRELPQLPRLWRDAVR